MIIRKGINDDLPEMLQLFTATIDEICKKDYNLQQLEAWKSGAKNKERWMKVMRDQYVLIALTENKIVGFCTLDQGNYIDLLLYTKIISIKELPQCFTIGLKKKPCGIIRKNLQLM